MWFRAGGGFYLITAHYLLGIGAVVTNGWSLLVDVDNSESSLQT